MADEKEHEVTVEYLVDFGDKKKGDKGKLPLSEAWRLSHQGIVARK